MSRTKAVSIPREVKKAVAVRDTYDGWVCCILCGKPAPSETAWCCAHYIPRSQGGLGIERNIITLCPDCHRDYDQSTKRAEIKSYIRAYLQMAYTDWNEQNLTYRKDEERG